MSFPDLNPVTDDFVAKLRVDLPPKTFGELSPRYVEEIRKRYTGIGGVLLKPALTAEVAAIVAACGREKIGIVPYGGGTGLVAGQLMPEGPDPVILSLERMNNLRAVHPAENVLIVEAGMVLADVQAAADAAGRLFALSLASEGTCQIGGNLSTNAGGVSVLRFGNTRDLCLGLEAVLPDGSIWHGLKRLRKDNTGYDLRNLLIGAEGSLGIITAAALKMMPKPDEYHTAYLSVRSPQAALDLLTEAQVQLAGSVSAFELIDRRGLEFLTEKLPQVRLPMPLGPPWMVLLDLGSMMADGMAARLERFLVRATEKELVDDGLIAQNQTQRREFWAVRETIPEANRLIGAVYSHDISVPVGDIPAFIEQGEALAKRFPDLRLNCFGHLGDGNLHYNFFPPKGRKREEYDDIREDIKDAVYQLVSSFGGSISAEHGIGRMKIADLDTYGDPVKIATMRAIKAALDPSGIMNPGAVVKR